MVYGFHYKCPLCGEISWYDFPIEDLARATEEPTELIVGRCSKCGRQWAKYAYIVFGGDDKS